ncbi:MULTISPECIES: GIY-YIG nuclease family protein [Arsenophonus]|jgi:putative endonuclease|uniref:GIY-YIG nuclease family protein n=1 Tax=Arsenophonus TaxID=637 RepID=UPI0015D6F2B6|nr:MULTISPECIES: GIY-YIG nuclease family protein [Arsenophonus]UBX29399.1 GIY-YIG nuclease family protein [Arsenophonus apicola]
MTKKPWSIYLIRNRQNALYTGITTDITRRLQQHHLGKGAKALRGKSPLLLVYQCQLACHSDALSLEYQIKQLTKVQKEQLVADQPLDLASYLAPLALIKIRRKIN